MYVSWTLSVIFMAIVQAILIYISWELSADVQWVDMEETGTTSRDSETSSGKPSSLHHKSSGKSSRKSKVSRISSIGSSSDSYSSSSGSDNENS